MDVLAHDGDTVLRFDLPGVDPAADLSVTATEGELVVQGERRELPGVEEKDYYRRETFCGQFERHVPLPEGTPGDKITAEYENGILDIHIPGPSKPVSGRKAKTIPVKTAAPARSRTATTT